MHLQHFLTAREKEIFEMLVRKLDTSEIADKLRISEKTVRNHISNVIQKLDANSRVGAVLELIKLNELSF